MTNDERDTFLAAFDEYERQLDALAAGLDCHKVGAGWYKLSSPAEGLFANLRLGREYDGENVTQWYADIRYTDGSGLKQHAGIWPTLREAKREVARIITPPAGRPAFPYLNNLK